MAQKELRFKIGATSYVYPDDILPNVQKLKDKVNDIELVLFEADNAGNIPTQKDLKELRRINNKRGLTYTVHLPLDINLGSEIDGQRERAVECARVLIERLSVVNPYAYILHLNLPGNARRQLNLWQDRVSDSLKQIIKGRKAIAKNIAIENLSYPFKYVESIIKENNCTVCVDIGHLITMGFDPLEHCKKYFKTMRVVHLYGVNGRKDHVSLKYLDAGLLKRLIRFLREKAYHGVLTLEVFSQADFEESMDILWENLYS
ncbi:MAG: cobamide remodeling phosphodiesterase CbiR [Candidatus Omnitrophota bacterium]|nr:cobamide remodeling phosphodiesterase CbiR [Candidatus Omnitrophota bacterium]